MKTEKRFVSGVSIYQLSNGRFQVYEKKDNGLEVLVENDEEECDSFEFYANAFSVAVKEVL